MTAVGKCYRIIENLFTQKHGFTNKNRREPIANLKYNTASGGLGSLITIIETSTDA